MARIVFDLDGTLIDSAPDIAAAANLTLAEVGAAPLSLAQVRSFVGAGAHIFVKRMAAARVLDDPTPLIQRFMHHYDGAVALTQRYEGVQQALETLRRGGHRLGLCTNKPLGPTRNVLAHFGWEDMFETVLGGDSLGVRKPDPAPLHAAFAGLGEGPRLYLGDSEVDAETAARAGVALVLHTEGYRKAPLADLPHAAAFDDWADVPDLVAHFAV